MTVFHSGRRPDGRIRSFSLAVIVLLAVSTAPGGCDSQGSAGGKAGGAPGGPGGAFGGGAGTGSGGAGGAPLPPGCCLGSDDCTDPVQRHCVFSSESGMSAGVCKDVPTDTTRCWTNSDCATGKFCYQARICPCGAECLVADQTGYCAVQ